MSNYLNSREPYLHSDFSESKSLPDIYDSDLENFWTQKSKLFSNLDLIEECYFFIETLQKKENFVDEPGKETSQDKMNLNINIQNQKFKVNALYQIVLK